MAVRNLGRMSRRGFIAGAGACATIAAGAGTRVATADSARTETSPEAAVETAGYTVVDTDVLVVGAGTGGVYAALQAYNEGAVVTVIDKGPFRYSGATGMNWDAGAGTGTPKVPTIEDPSGTWVDALTNKKLSAKAIEFIGSDAEAWNRPLTFCRMGNTTFWRNDAGELAIASNEQSFMRHTVEYLASSSAVNVIDQTMVTALLMSGGACCGVIGLHVPTGTYRVVRAKAVVIADGGSTQMYGWSGTGALSINTPDNTGDVDVAAYRRGCSLINPEFFSYDLISLKPAAIGGSFASGLGADSVSKDLVCDAEGNHYLADETFVGYQPITVATSKVIREGKGSPDGCVYLDLSSPDAQELTRPAYWRNVSLWKDVFGIDATKPDARVEIGVEAFEHMGTPVVDENMMTELPGLFNVRGAGNMMMLHTNHYLAAYAGHCARAFAASAERLPLDEACVIDEVGRLEQILAADGDIRPHVIRHKIQDAVYRALYLGCDAAGLETAIAEIDRIRDEDIPRTLVSNKTRCLNFEWRSAIENLNLVVSAEAALRASLMREESRVFFYRADFPEQDNENWLVNILAKSGDSGMELTARPVVGLD